MTYKQLSGLIRATLNKGEEDKEVEVRIGNNSYSNLTLVSTEEDTFLNQDTFLNPNQPEPTNISEKNI
jgi:hypothetical protein